MSEKNIATYTREDLNKLPSKTDWKRLKTLTDEDIAKAAADDPDAAPIDLDWSDAELWIPVSKKAVSLRIDKDVLEFFRTSGRGYQTRMNAVLRQYMMHQLKKKKRA